MSRTINFRLILPFKLVFHQRGHWTTDYTSPNLVMRGFNSLRNSIPAAADSPQPPWVPVKDWSSWIQKRLLALFYIFFVVWIRKRINFLNNDHKTFSFSCPGETKHAWVKLWTALLFSSLLSRFVFKLQCRVHGKLSPRLPAPLQSDGKKTITATRMFLQLVEILLTLSNVILNEKANIF